MLGMAAGVLATPPDLPRVARPQLVADKVSPDQSPSFVCHLAFSARLNDLAAHGIPTVYLWQIASRSIPCSRS